MLGAIASKVAAMSFMTCVFYRSKPKYWTT